MKFLHNIRREIKIGSLLIIAFSMIGFIGKKHEHKLCNDIRIMVHNNGSNYFLDKEDVYKLVTADDSDFVIGSTYGRIDLKAIEQRVLASDYVAEAQAYANLRGQVTVEVFLCQPIARFMIDGQKDRYICESGRIIPTSPRYTSRVLLITGEFTGSFPEKNVNQDSAMAELFELIRYIHGDEFWRAQIAQMDIDRKGNVVLYPQVTKQYIEFGKPESIEAKFLKLETFYKTILPYKGWNYYTRVNVEYKDQIVCE